MKEIGKVYEEENIEFANSIDFTELFRHAEVLSGTVLTFSGPNVVVKGVNVYINFVSNDIASTCGAFGKILEKCVIESSNNGICRDEKTDELVYWVYINISYSHVEGGSNGMNLFDARYTNGNWSFRNAGEGCGR